MVEKYSAACAIFVSGPFTFALTSKSLKTIDTLYKLNTETGEEEEIQLRTLAKNSASKLPEVRQEFAWFTTTAPEVMLSEGSADEQGRQQECHLSLFMHGGSVTNPKTKKKKYLSDFFHLDVEEGLFRKFFLFDAAKGRANHSMARIGNEVFLYGGQGLKEVLHDDMWRFNLDNVQWTEQKQADLVGIVAEKQTQGGQLPGKLSGHIVLPFAEANSLLLVSQKLTMMSYNTQTNYWTQINDYPEEENGLEAAIKVGPSVFGLKTSAATTIKIYRFSEPDQATLVQEIAVPPCLSPAREVFLSQDDLKPLQLLINDNVSDLQPVEEDEEEDEEEDLYEAELRLEIQSLEAELADLEKEDEGNEKERDITGQRQELLSLQENVEAFEGELVVKSQVMAQMERGIQLFQEQASDEAAVIDCKQREATQLTNLIISGESLAVRLDQQVLSIVDLVHQQSDLQSVLAGLDPDLTQDLQFVEEEKVKHQGVLRHFLSSMGQADQPQHVMN